MSNISQDDLTRCKVVVEKEFKIRSIEVNDEQLTEITKDIMRISDSHGGGHVSDTIRGFTKGYIDSGLYFKYLNDNLGSSRFEDLVAEVKSDIQELLDYPEVMPSYMKESQLRMTLEELDKMARIKNINEFLPYYPRGISDSWDFNDKLGQKLMRLLDVYRRL